MASLTETNLTEEVLSRFPAELNPRFRQIMAALIRHTHDFVREVGLTPEEWKAGIDFLTATGHITDDKRQEFILLSDTLGVSALVDLINHHSHAGGSTESSLLGPFYREGAPEMATGANIAQTQGEPLVVRGRVTASDGRPLAGATLDVWQGDPRGLYDIQDPTQPDMNLRGKFRTDAQGRYEFRTIKPKFYPVPTDGPVGALLQAQGRHPFRPAHIHFIVSAQGYWPLTTALYTAGDQYLESDAVFGARDALVVNYKPYAGNGANGGAGKQEKKLDSIEFDFALAPK